MPKPTGKLRSGTDTRDEGTGPNGSSVGLTTLYVHILAPDENEAHPEAVQSDYRQLIERTVEAHEGELIAVAGDAVLATFSTSEGISGRGSWGGLRAAVTLLKDVAGLNRQRLAQDLNPLRVGIGLDRGNVPADGIKRHPRLRVGLDRYISRARRLSILNCQTPFPAVFLSGSVARSIGDFNGYTIQDLGEEMSSDHNEPVAVYALMPVEELKGDR